MLKIAIIFPAKSKNNQVAVGRHDTFCDKLTNGGPVRAVAGERLQRGRDFGQDLGSAPAAFTDMKEMAAAQRTHALAK